MILGINTDGKKEVLTIQVGDNESSKYWLSVLNELKNRGVKDILLLCADGLTGIKETIAAAFPKTEYQRCIVHQVRNTLKYVPDKDRKAFATDLRTIYQASDEKKALDALDRVTEKWTPKYPNSMKRWKDNWDAISPIFKFSSAPERTTATGWATACPPAPPAPSALRSGRRPPTTTRQSWPPRPPKKRPPPPCPAAARAA